jgi:hypothetical protein
VSNPSIPQNVLANQIKECFTLNRPPAEGKLCPYFAWDQDTHSWLLKDRTSGSCPLLVIFRKRAENGESELSSLNPIGTPSAFFA